MNNGTILAVFVVAAFLGAEIFAFYKVSYRTEPDYIHNLLIEAKTATEICDSDVAAVSEQFDRTLMRVRKNLAQKYEEENPAISQAELDLKLTEQEELATQRISQSMPIANCGSQEMKNHLVRYKIYARKS